MWRASAPSIISLDAAMIGWWKVAAWSSNTQTPRFDPRLALNPLAHRKLRPALRPTCFIRPVIESLTPRPVRELSMSKPRPSSAIVTVSGVMVIRVAYECRSTLSVASRAAAATVFASSSESQTSGTPVKTAGVRRYSVSADSAETSSTHCGGGTHGSSHRPKGRASTGNGDRQRQADPGRQ